MNLSVSVVVPTYKRADFLERCLQALLVQQFTIGMYEIIIVDDADDAETKQQVERFARCAPGHACLIRYLAIPANQRAHGPAVARNAGWRASRAAIIAFTDDDCIPQKDWLQAGVCAFKEDVIAVSGRIVVPLPLNPTDYEFNVAQLEKSEFATANCFYRRSALCEVGGFDEHFRAAWREDSDLFFTLLDRRARCVFANDAVVQHPARPAPWGVSIREQRKSAFNALLYKKHPELYRRRIQASAPRHYYCIVGCLLLALISLLVEAWPLCLCAFLVWMLMTGSFCITRLRATSHAPLHILEMIFTSILIPPLAVFWRLRGAVTFRVFFL